MKMKVFGRKVIDWAKINDIPPEKRKEKILGAVNHFIKKVDAMPHENVKTTGADPNLTGQSPIALTMSDTIKTPDRGYEVLFDEMDMRQSTNKAFDVLDVSGGVTFYQQLPGERAQLSKLPTAAKTAVSMLRFTGGFAILDDWLRFNEYYKIDQLTADTVRRWYNDKATIMYGLIEALGSGINESFDTDDVTTINNACAKIQTDLAAAGYPIDENPSFWILAHPNLKMRLMKALASAFINPNSNSNQIVWPIAGIVNTTKIATSSYYVGLPGYKNQKGEWEDLNARPAQRDELKLGADHVWTGAYNAVIAESKQWRRCSLS
ncbi:MAG: hypothetical protein ACOCTS_03360 [Thermodesulfobacteriota bacterium]